MPSVAEIKAYLFSEGFTGDEIQAICECAEKSTHYVQEAIAATADAVRPARYSLLMRVMVYAVLAQFNEEKNDEWVLPAIQEAKGRRL